MFAKMINFLYSSFSKSALLVEVVFDKYLNDLASVSEM